ncbi:MAG: cytochrome c oxidase subunit 3 [Myxococcota bacterium]|nr:cytochrome c oxidase subunit 3 [Myxococcota bacterium]
MDAAPSALRILPVRRPPIIANGVLGMMLFVVAESMFFAGLISSFTIVKSNAMGLWPPPGQPLLPAAETALNTAALLISGLGGLFVAWRFRKQAPSVALPLGISWLLGAAFVALQGREWLMLLSQGLSLRSSQLGSFFFVIVGAHALHAIAALVALGMAWWRAHQGTLKGEFLFTTLVFWWFVVAAWPVIYFRVYF